MHSAVKLLFFNCCRCRCWRCSHRRPLLLLLLLLLCKCRCATAYLSPFATLLCCITLSQKAANESRSELEAALAGADMVFVTVRVHA